MPKITLDDINNLQNETTATATINNNNRSIREAVEDTLSRSGKTPNNMNATLDMNSNRIINLPSAVEDTEPVTLGQLQDIENIIANTFITSDQEPGLPQSRKLAAGLNVSITDDGAQSNIYVGVDNAELNALASAGSSSNTLPYYTAVGAASTTPFTSYARSLVDDSNSTEARTTLGLDQVDNTSDLNKPISTATQGALDLKADKTTTLSAGTGLTGGGDLSANRTIALDSASIASLGKADSAVQPGSLGSLAAKSQIDVPGDINATGTPSSSTYLRGDGVWAAGGGGGGGDLLAANNLADLANADTALDNLGATVLGKALFTAANAAAARSSIGAANIAGDTFTGDVKAPGFISTSGGLVVRYGTPGSSYVAFFDAGFPSGGGGNHWIANVNPSSELVFLTRSALDDSNLGTPLVLSPTTVTVSGNLTVTGSLSKSSGTFDIPHPLVSGKRLVHGFVEAPGYLVLYRGVTTLVAGRATVDIDAAAGMTSGTFAALTKNAVVQSLQNQNSFARLRPGPIVGGSFEVVCEDDASTDHVAWFVVAERNDDYIRNDDPHIDRETGEFIAEYDAPEKPEVAPMPVDAPAQAE